MPQTPSTSHLGLALDGQPLEGAGCSGRLDSSSVGGDGVAQRLAVLKQRGGGLAGAASDMVDACPPSGLLAHAGLLAGGAAAARRRPGRCCF